MASKTQEKYELYGEAKVGEDILLQVNSTQVYNEAVPAWATLGATIYFKVVFKKENIP